MRLFILLAIVSVLGCQPAIQKKANQRLLTNQNLLHNNMPAWEVPNMLAKYYTTTQARKLASKK